MSSCFEISRFMGVCVHGGQLHALTEVRKCSPDCFLFLTVEAEATTFPLTLHSAASSSLSFSFLPIIRAKELYSFLLMKCQIGSSSTRVVAHTIFIATEKQPARNEAFADKRKKSEIGHRRFRHQKTNRRSHSDLRHSTSRAAAWNS